jgi:hypothetical protein
MARRVETVQQKLGLHQVQILVSAQIFQGLQAVPEVCGLALLQQMTIETIILSHG